MTAAAARQEPGPSNGGPAVGRARRVRTAPGRSATRVARAVGYCRVSTLDQAEHGVSLDAQEAKVRAMAQLQDLDLVDVVRDEGASAKSLDRAGVQRVLAMVRRGEVDAVVVAKLDRLTRSVRDLGELLELCQRRGVALLSVAESLDTGSAAGRMVVGMLGVVAQWEREAIGERTAEALQHKRARGEHTGGEAPFGFRVGPDGVRLEEDPGEQLVLQAARELRRAGRSLRALARELTARGFRTRAGGPWHAQGVHRMLRAAHQPGRAAAA